MQAQAILALFPPRETDLEFAACLAFRRRTSPARRRPPPAVRITQQGVGDRRAHQGQHAALRQPLGDGQLQGAVSALRPRLLHGSQSSQKLSSRQPAVSATALARTPACTRAKPLSLPPRAPSRHDHRPAPSLSPSLPPLHPPRAGYCRWTATTGWPSWRARPWRRARSSSSIIITTSAPRWVASLVIFWDLRHWGEGAPPLPAVWKRAGPSPPPAPGAPTAGGRPRARLAAPGAGGAGAAGQGGEEAGGQGPGRQGRRRQGRQGRARGERQAAGQRQRGRRGWRPKLSMPCKAWPERGVPAEVTLPANERKESQRARGGEKYQRIDLRRAADGTVLVSPAMPAPLPLPS